MSPGPRLKFLVLLLAMSLSWPATAAERGDLIAKGLEQLKRGRFDAAEKTFKKATKVEKGPCGECQLGLAMVYSRQGEWRKGEKAARAAVDELESHPQQPLAFGELGKICLERAMDKPSYLECAEDSFRAAGDSAESQFYLGFTLLKRSKDEEGLAVLRRYVNVHSGDRHVAMARSLIDRPLRARKDLVPDFEWQTLRGQKLTNEELAGKVMLLDFWATWCKPCRNAVPALREIADKHADDPFVLVSLSVDTSEGKVRDFVRDHSIKWPQVWDIKKWGASHLRVNSYPTYIIIGPDGSILKRYTGGGGGIEKNLAKDVAKAIRAAKKAAKKST